jgi:hypothetical protein
VSRGRLLVALAVLAALVAALGWWGLSVTGPGRRGSGRDARAPAGERIRVEVLNATRTRGLARRATRHLRDRGFDVVAMGNADATRDSTLVLDRAGNAEWARLVAEALGGARVESRPDTSRYLDVTVLLGASWTPPAEPFDP